MAWYSEDFIREIPKTDIHVHLDGSLRIPTLLELAHQRGVRLPSDSEDGLKQTVFKDKYKDLNEYLQGFSYTTAVMSDAPALERIAYELAEDNIDEGVCYLEVRFAPQLHIREDFSFEQVMTAVDNGLRRKRDQFNASRNDDEPAFEYGIIVCAMRFFNEHFSPYYKDLFRIHRHSPAREIIRYASLELSRAAVALRKSTNIQLVGFDLAGSEFGYPASAHQASYQYANKNFLHRTVHAGEAYGPESIFQAITDLHAERIGHGMHLFNPDMIQDASIEDHEGYLIGLQQFIADKRITLEVCLTSNMQTSPHLKRVSDHPLKHMLEANLSVTLCTDNRLVSHTSVTGEILLALENFDINAKQLKNSVIYGFKRSYFYGNYNQKRSYVRTIINRYEELERRFFNTRK